MKGRAGVTVGSYSWRTVIFRCLPVPAQPQARSLDEAQRNPGGRPETGKAAETRSRIAACGLHPGYGQRPLVKP